MRVLIFGDSVAQGFYDSMGGWVNQLATHYFKEVLEDNPEHPIHVFNLGILGDTAMGVLKRIETETKDRRTYPDEECIVIAIGINNSILIDNRPFNEEYDFEEVYGKIVDKALELCPRVLCVGLTAVDEDAVNASGDTSFFNNRINLFEDIIKQVALTKEVAFVPIHDSFLKHMKDVSMLADGLHPSDAGHQLIAREVKSAIEALR